MELAIKNLAVWGDSLFKGTIYDEQKNRHLQLKEHALHIVEETLHLPINNNCIFGCTIIKGEEKLIKTLEKNSKSGITIDAAIIEFGGNDCDFDWEQVSNRPDDDHQPKTPLNQFINSYEKMLNLLIAENIKPILVSLQPLHAPRYFQWIRRDLVPANILHWLGDIERIYRQQERYSLAITNLAYKYQCHYIDLRSAFLKVRDYHELLCSDGIHPNQAGHQIIAAEIIKYAQATGFK
ncbi:MAG: SGNH/GDSL hydrolase family protein [Bacillota bacterium]|jgi:acyl-CoA thioesterase-1